MNAPRVLGGVLLTVLIGSALQHDTARAADERASGYAVACAMHPRATAGGVRPCAALATAQRCSHEADFPSRPTQEAVVLTVVNRSDENVDFYWLSGSGARVLYASIAPGDHVDQQSHTGAHWLLATTSGQCLGVFDAATMKLGIF